VDGFQGVKPDMRRDEWVGPMQSLIPGSIASSLSHLNLGIKIKRPDSLVDALDSAHQVLLDELGTFCEVLFYLGNCLQCG
jgi:hypothetical protein